MGELGPGTVGRYGRWICLDWHDGPLSEIALVTFDDGDKIVEIKTLGGWRDGDQSRLIPLTRLRLDRETLVAMLDLIDGKPVKGFHDDVED